MNDFCWSDPLTEDHPNCSNAQHPKHPNWLIQRAIHTQTDAHSERARALASKSSEGDLFKRLVSYPCGWIRKTKHKHYIYPFPYLMLQPHHDKNYVHLPAPGLAHCPQTAAMNNNSANIHLTGHWRHSNFTHWIRPLGCFFFITNFVMFVTTMVEHERDFHFACVCVRISYFVLHGASDNRTADGPVATVTTCHVNSPAVGFRLHARTKFTSWVQEWDMGLVQNGRAMVDINHSWNWIATPPQLSI